MKYTENIKKVILTYLVSFLAMIICLAQTYDANAQILSEDFNGGLPSNWTQGSGAVTWTHNVDKGKSGSGCAMAYFVNGGSATNWYQTPFIDLTQASQKEIKFSVALIENNFVPPNTSLWYDNGSGWVRLRRYGIGPNVDQTIAANSDTSPPLDASNVTWVDLTYDLTSLASNTNIRFSFAADISNGGWVLLDDVSIPGTKPNAVSDLEKQIGLAVYPNPSKGAFTMNWKSNKVSQVEVYNLAGQLIISKSTEGTEENLNLTQEPNGFYFALVKDQDGYPLAKQVLSLSK